MVQNKLKEIISEEAQTLDLLSIDFKTISNMVIELNEIRKIMSEQNKNVNIEILIILKSQHTSKFFLKNPF